MEKIKKDSDGFLLNEEKDQHYDVAFLSLRLALKAYFNTYKSVSYCLSNFINSQCSIIKNDRMYSINYIEDACEAITHFQNFAELVLKDILRQKHILLANKLDGKKKYILDILLDGKNITESEIKDNITGRSIEFSETINRIETLLENKKFEHTNYDFLLLNVKWLRKLNYLRNRISHRGIYVLRYKALDVLFTKDALPFMKKVLALERYKNQRGWQFDISSNIHLIDSMINCYGNSYKSDKLAILKEMGRAAYNNPLVPTKNISSNFYNKDIIKRAMVLSTHVLQHESNGDLKTCPVCGIKSLVQFNDFHEIEDKNGIEVYEFVYMIKCFCCSFELRGEPTGLDQMELPFDNFWHLD